MGKQHDAEPSWRDRRLGTMKRGALWLAKEVGEGNVFTKAEMRDAFPETAQIDRRIRDLRAFGWRIDTSREDPSLDSSEQRLVTCGESVWEPGKGMRKDSAVTAVARREVMQRDGHLCRSCGIGAGERFAGEFATAQLDVARRPVVMPSGRTELQLVTECNKCRVGARSSTVTLDATISGIRALPRMERDILRQWISKDRRSFSSVERLWGAYRSLPSGARAAIEAELADE